MLANLIEKIKTNAAFIKLRAAFSSIFHFLHKKFLWGAFKRIDEKFFKFLFVGAINTVFAYTIYVIFVALGLVPNVALVFQYILGILWNFKTTGSIVFKNHDNKLIFKFFLSYIVTFLINSAFLYLLTEIIKMNDYLAQALLVVPIAVVSFFIMKFWVFK